jgi:hypothetical protein
MRSTYSCGTPNTPSKDGVGANCGVGDCVSCPTTELLVFHLVAIFQGVSKSYGADMLLFQACFFFVPLCGMGGLD